MKSPPSGSPTLIPPSLDRLDFPKLCAHAKTYRQKSGVSEEHQGWWVDYLTGMEKFVQGYSESSEHPVWPLQHLIDACRVQAVPTQNPSSTPPEYLLSLQRKETGTHPKVM